MYVNRTHIFQLILAHEAKDKAEKQEEEDDEEEIEKNNVEKDKMG